MISKSYWNEMNGFKTPLPVPVFYESKSTGYSTKKARQTPYYRLRKPPALTAPPISRSYQRRWLSQKAHRISFKEHTDSLSSSLYDIFKLDSYFKQCFWVEAKLGEGSFGEVYKVRSKEDGRTYAVKVSKETYRSETDRQERLNEVQKHETLPKHQNLLRFIKAWEEKGRLYIQTELCKMSLSDFALRVRDIPESLIWIYMVDLLLAVQHLHKHDLVHMDIKPENVFISEDNICKLGDFGLVIDLKKSNRLEDGCEGDSKYYAPELLENRVGKHADIFSLGVTILELACDLDLEYAGSSELLRSSDLPEDLLATISPELGKIIRLMLHRDYTQRPSASELLSMPDVALVVRRRRLSIAYRFFVNGVNKFLLLVRIYFLFYARFLRLDAILRLARSHIASSKWWFSYCTPSNRRLSFSPFADDDVAKELKMDYSSSDEEYSRDEFNEISSIAHQDSVNDLPSPVALPDSAGLEFVDSPLQSNFGVSFMKEKAFLNGRPWNSTPANDARMRRRIIEFNSPKNQKRICNGRTHTATTSFLAELECNHQETTKNLSFPDSPISNPDVKKSKRVTDKNASGISIPPKNLLEAFDCNESSSDDCI